MEDRRPPKRLPREYHEVWLALARADAAASSRADLARRLRVSTFTLQRILVDGDVPRLGRTESTRVLHSWIRILARLACYFGKEPRRWIESAGATWDDATRGIAEQAERGLGAQRRRPGSRAADESDGPAGRGSPAWLVGEGSEVEVGVADSGPFSRLDPGTSRSFLEEFAFRWLRAANPAIRLRFTVQPAAELTRTLAHPGNGLRLGIGIADTVAGRRAGLAFLHLPGWRLDFRALVRIDERGAAATLAWEDLTRSEAGPRLLVRAEGAAHAFLSGACGLPAERLVAVPADQVAGTFLQAGASGGPGPLVLVDDAAACARLRQEIESSHHPAARCAEIAPTGAAPGYPLALALPAAIRGWHPLLRAARDRELFGVARTETARLYAGFLAAVHHRVPFDPSARLYPFRLARPGFRIEASRFLVAALAPGSRAGEPAFLRALGTARKLLPTAWGSSLDEAFATPPGEPAAWHCQSCSASLHEGHNQGVSDAYCRYCSDETGRLRPREQVRSILARWFIGWQGEMPLEEATRRAEAYMSAMPAWSRN